MLVRNFLLGHGVSIALSDRRALSSAKLHHSLGQNQRRSQQQKEQLKLRSADSQTDRQTEQMKSVKIRHLHANMC